MEYTDKELKLRCGMLLLKKFIELIGINRKLGRLSLPFQGSNRRFDPFQLICNIWVSIWSGASRYEYYACFSYRADERDRYPKSAWCYKI